MDTETFRAPKVEQAIEEVKRKLGPNAVVVSVRQVPSGPVWQVWRQPDYEVVAMRAPEPTPAPQPAAPPATMALPEDPASRARLQSFMEQLYSQTKTAAEPAPQPAAARPAPAQPAPAPVVPPRAPEPNEEELNERGRAIAAKLLQQVGRQQAEREPQAPASGPLQEFRDQLLSQGVDEILTRKIIKGCSDSLSPNALEDRSRLKNFLEKQLQAVLKPRPESPLETDKIVCLIGLSGSGKTSTCAKLAAHCLQKPDWAQKKLLWITADTVSAGSIAEARSYTDALGIPLNVAYAPEELSAIIEADSDADLILVDTPACNPYKETNVVELGDFLTTLPHRATYLIVPATAKDSDLNRALASFRPFNLRGLVVTRLDETNTYGNVFNLAWRSQLPLLYLSSGPRIPSDLRLADTKRLINALLGNYSFGEDWVR